MTQDEIHFAWAHGTFTVLRAGAMCAPTHFHLPDGRSIQPFALCPWEDDGSPEFRDLPPLLKRLRGDWVCVPFGMPDTRTDLPADWSPDEKTGFPTGGLFHGPSANSEWVVTETGAGSVTLTLIYPDKHPIAQITRRIHGDPSTARLLFELEILPREDCRLPVGVHPVLRLPETPGSAKLTVEGATGVFTYPVDAEPGVSLLPHGTCFQTLESARWADGTQLDMSRHPLNRRTEEIVLVAGATGRAHLDNEIDRWRVTVGRDPKTFAACNLWMSNGGRGYYPWNHRFSGLGVEPVSAPFDLGVDVANRGAHALSRTGVPLSVAFRAGETWRTQHFIEVSSI